MVHPVSSMSFARSCTHVLVNLANPYAGMRGAHAESPVIWMATKTMQTFSYTFAGNTKRS